MSAAVRHTRRHLVEWSYCDAAGFVFNGRYFEWFDACTTEFFASVGVSLATLFRTRGVMVPVVDHRVRYIAPCHFGDEIAIETSAVSVGTTSFTLNHRVFKARRLVAECREVRVWAVRVSADPPRLVPRPVPRGVAARLAPAGAR